MRMKLTLALGLVVLAVLNFWIYTNERFIETGEEVYFELVPVDPRSLLQGDYMRLNYKIVNNLRAAIRIPATVDEPPLNAEEIPREGKIVVRIDEKRVASYQRIWEPGESLGENERLLRYSQEGRHVGSTSFFFEEGRGEAYEKARYGIFKLGKDGRTILRSLADENLVRIEPGPMEKSP